MKSDLFSPFTNLYPIQKTPRRELKPLNENFEHDLSLSALRNSEIPQRDEQREKDYQAIKPLLDELHNQFITESLQSLEPQDRSDFVLFYQTYQGSPYNYHKIPYPGGYLPALRIECPDASRTLLVLGGFDGMLEELCDFVAPLQNQGYHLILFDGPGQGQTYQQGLTFQPNFEVPVKVVLDYFGLKSCDAMGLSWGGYFVMRAAAFEPRIQSVICLDIFYSAMDALKLTLGPAAYSGFRLLYHLRAKSLINALTDYFTKSNIQLKWSLQNGYQLTGEKTPYDFYRNLDRHPAGQEDQYVPAYRLKQMKRKLIHAKAIESHFFTSQTGGALHCQMDRLDLVYPLVLDFLRKYSH